jgi:hypothetical protein
MNNEFDILIPNYNTNSIRKLGEIDHASLLPSLQDYIESLNENKKEVGLRIVGHDEVIGDLRRPRYNPNGYTQNDFENWVKGTEEVQKIAKQYNIGNKGRVRLFMLTPETNYIMHGDQDFYRVHVPLITNDESFLIVDNRLWRLEIGSIYLVKVKDRHTAMNAGKTNRIHLVFDDCEYLI